MICIPITARTKSEMAAMMQAAAKKADLLELRMDYAPRADLVALLRSRPRPVIVTNRPRRQGGQFDGEEAERLALLQRAVDLGADYVDVELDSVHRIRRNGPTRFIVSHHDWECTPEGLQRIHADIVRAGADVVKIVGMARDIRDNLRMFELLRSVRHPTIALCMGELGLISRILGRKFGNYLTFASLDLGRESAPGQITADELRNLYRYEKIGAGTAVYGVVANPVAHSMSPAIHNAAFEACDLDAVYLPFKVEGDPVEFVAAFRAVDVKGYSVTLPHKERIIGGLDEVDDLARRIGAVNTVVNRQGRLWGTNTDAAAASSALEEAYGSDLAGKSVLILGAGGAARAVAFALVSRGARVIIANRTHDRAVSLAAEVGCQTCRLADVRSVRADVLVNTTSVGMHPMVDVSPAPSGVLRRGMVVMDAVYNPPETKLIKEARAAGCRVVTGIAWFVNQAAAQFELWTGMRAPRKRMEAVLRERLAAGP